MSTQPSRRPSGRDDDPPSLRSEARISAREGRLATLVEAFLHRVRQGGSLDPEPFLERAEELRAELGPLLANVLRLESVARTLQGRPEEPPRSSESDEPD